MLVSISESMCWSLFKCNKPGLFVNFGQFPCSWIQICVRIPNTDPYSGHPNQCGYGSGFSTLFLRLKDLWIVYCLWLLHYFISPPPLYVSKFSYYLHIILFTAFFCCERARVLGASCFLGQEPELLQVGIPLLFPQPPVSLLVSSVLLSLL